VTQAQDFSTNPDGEFRESGLALQFPMGINRTTLISRMKKLGIDPRQYAS
jgi:hypothetical protein